MRKMFFVIFLCASICGHSAEIPYAMTDLVFQNEQAIDNEVNAFKTTIDEQLSLFIKSSLADSYDTAYSAWNSAYLRFFSLKLLFGQNESRLTPTLVNYMQKQYGIATQFLRSAVEKKNVLTAFVHNGLNAKALTPHQRALTKNILIEFKENYPNQDDITAAIDKLIPLDSSNFSFFTSGASVVRRKDELRVFTANIICFPDELGWFYGGICAWDKRMDRLKDVINSTKADIVCLQEVWDTNAMQALIKQLSKDYAYFIYDAGSQFDTLEPSAIGMNSGLFVASKLPLKNVKFVPFPRSIPAKAAAKRGLVLASCDIGNEPFFFGTTHLQHGSDEMMKEVRLEQLQLCYSELQKMPENAWGCLLGDININAFSDEFYQCQMPKLFSIPYLKNQSKLTSENTTCTDYFTDLVNTPLNQRSSVKPVIELLDYCMCPVNRNKQPLSQTKVKLFELKEPAQALSDHQGLLTIWSLKTLSN